MIDKIVNEKTKTNQCRFCSFKMIEKNGFYLQKHFSDEKFNSFPDFERLTEDIPGNIENLHPSPLLPFTFSFTFIFIFI